jgi:hypothetical protein
VKGKLPSAVPIGNGVGSLGDGSPPCGEEQGSRRYAPAALLFSATRASLVVLESPVSGSLIKSAGMATKQASGQVAGDCSLSIKAEAFSDVGPVWKAEPIGPLVATSAS